MPREPRKLTEFVHVVNRGNGQQIIFEDEEDYISFLQRLRQYSRELNVEIICYCLMENHIHLLLQDKNENISTLMRKLGISYAHYYNKKYNRVGHLFQGRFKSENIISDRHLISTFRYILDNPRKAGIARPDRYRWSSYSEYGTAKGITNSLLISELLGDVDLYSFVTNESYDKDLPTKEKNDDEWALDVIKKNFNVKSGTELQGYSKDKRDQMLAVLKEAGLSYGQISRLTGISKVIIKRAKYE